LEGSCWLTLDVELGVSPFIGIFRLWLFAILAINHTTPRGDNAAREAIGNVSERLIAATFFVIFANHD
jgi:hypothetical protein